jgi:hypothetical protein
MFNLFGAPAKPASAPARPPAPTPSAAARGPSTASSTSIPASRGFVPATVPTSAPASAPAAPASSLDLFGSLNVKSPAADAPAGGGNLFGCAYARHIPLYDACDEARTLGLTSSPPPPPRFPFQWSRLVVVVRACARRGDGLQLHVCAGGASADGPSGVWVWLRYEHSRGRRRACARAVLAVVCGRRNERPE